MYAQPSSRTRGTWTSSLRKRCNMAKTKKKGFQAWRNEALRHFQKYRRLVNTRNGYTVCISCQAVHHWKQMDGGHYIPRTIRITELEPDNVWPQCKQCNGFQEGNTVAYRFSLMKLIGLHRVERLENLRMAAQGSDEHFNKLSDEDKRAVVRKRTAADYQALALQYRKLNTQLEKNV